MSVRRICRPCRKAYRVPEEDREYRCKQCGAALVAEDAAAEGEGAASAARGADREDRPSRASREDRDEVKRANAELLRWRKRHKALKMWFLYGPGATYTMAAAALALLLFLYGNLVWGAVAAVIAVAIGLGTRFLGRLADRKPVLATSVFAVLATLSALLATFEALLDGEGQAPALVPAIVLGMSVLGVWQAKQAERLLERVPEAYRRKARDERAQVRGESVRERDRERARRGRESESRLAVWILVGVAAVIGLVAVAVWFAKQPTDPAPVLQAFRVDWEEGDVDGIAAVANSERIGKLLRRYWDRQGWVESPPDLHGWEQTRAEKDRVHCDFLLADGRVSDTRWMWDADAGWRLIAFGYPQEP